MAHSVPRPAASAAILVLVLAAFVAWHAAPPASAQRTVTVASTNPHMAVSTPTFIETGKVYAFRWTGSDNAENYRISATRPDGWVEVDSNPYGRPSSAFAETPKLWINVGLAVSIRELPGRLTR